MRIITSKTEGNVFNLASRTKKPNSIRTLEAEFFNYCATAQMSLARSFNSENVVFSMVYYLNKRSSFANWSIGDRAILNIIQSYNTNIHWRLPEQSILSLVTVNEWLAISRSEGDKRRDIFRKCRNIR